MKKFTLFIMAISIAIVSFGQKHSTKTYANPAFSSKAQMISSIPNQINPSGIGKVFWTPSSGAKINYLTQNFDGTWLPTAWTQTTYNASYTWLQGNFTGIEFSNIDPTSVYSAACDWSPAGSTQNEWLKSTSITGTSTASSLFVKFWAGFNYSYLPVGGLGNPGSTLQCKISTNGGSTWTTLWDANNTPSFTGWEWQEISCNITAYKNAPFLLAWVITGSDGDGITLDNVMVYEPASNDAGVTKIMAPISSCSNLGSAENVTVQIKNFGTAAISGVPVSYKINNNAPVTATYSGSILPGDTVDYTFASSANLSVPGNYVITAYTGLTGDGVLSNDTTIAYLYSGSATIPFSMGFETTDNLTGWSLTDANADGYTWGIYTGASYAHTGSGFAIYQYNSTSAANDWLFTKCINLTSGTSYQLKFYYRAMNVLYPEALNVNIGQTTLVSGMTTQLVDLPNISDTNYQQSTTVFTVPSSGTYFIGFHCKSAADMYNLFIDDITVTVPAVNPVASCNPLSWAAGNVAISTTVTSGTFTLTNTGTGTLTCSGILGISAPFTTTFVPASVNLAAGASSTFTFSYNPTALGANNQTVYLTTNGGNITINLSGTGTTCTPINTFPWIESFEGTFTPSCWTKLNPDGGTGWAQIAAGTNPVPGFGGGTMSVPAGGGTYAAYSSYQTGGTSYDDQWLITPQINVPANAMLRFSLFWYGSYQDLVDIKISTTTNAISSFTATVLALDTTQLIQNAWKTFNINLSSYVGQNIFIAFQEHVANNSIDGAFIGLDKVSIDNGSIVDVGITDIKAPISSCSNLSASESVIVKIQNFGSNSITGFPVSYKINNNTPVTITFSGSLPAGDSVLYTFTGANAANLSASGNYTIAAYTSAVGDVDPANDTSMAYIYSGAATIPFSMGFEPSDDLTGWMLSDMNMDGYSWGIYIGAKYAHSGTGFAAYPYNVDGLTAADDWLFTKCIYLLAGNSYQLKFYYRALLNIYPEAMNVNIGQTNSAIGMTTQLVDLTSITDTTYPVSNTLFAVPISGAYYVGFHCKSAANMDYLLLDDISIDLVTNVAENKVPEISIYPNPATNMVTVNSSEKISHLKVLDVLGNVVYEEDAGQNTVQLNTSDYSKGIYFVVVNTEKQNFTRKLQIIK
jgi:hypothetical protein